MGNHYELAGRVLYFEVCWADGDYHVPESISIIR